MINKSEAISYGIEANKRLVGKPQKGRYVFQAETHLWYFGDTLYPDLTRWLY